jgi:hypothetical protein
VYVRHDPTDLGCGEEETAVQEEALRLRLVWLCLALSSISYVHMAPARDSTTVATTGLSAMTDSSRVTCPLQIDPASLFGSK